MTRPTYGLTHGQLGQDAPERSRPTAGASTRELMPRMGHASPEAALRYQHTTRARGAELAAALGDLVKDARPARVAPSARWTHDGTVLNVTHGRTRPSRIRSDLRIHTQRRRESNPRSQLGIETCAASFA